MNAYAYKAALYCEHCANEIKKNLERSTGKPPIDMRDDSEAWPQGPYSNGADEADTPQHCDCCHAFLENPLTGDGENYVKEAIKANSGNPAVLTTWKEFYSYLF
jgi:hypothetical protein